MFKQRVITAIVLLAILLPAIFYPSPVPFCFLALVLVGAAGWEWGRLNAVGQPASLALGFLCVVASGGLWSQGWTQPSPVLWGFAGPSWVLLAAWMLASGVGAWARVPKVLRLLGGVVVLVLTWLAIAQARTIGVNFLFSIMFLVWVSDIAAYFAGKAFGGEFFRRKLAPSISPGKSWEGVVGGCLGVLVLTFAWTVSETASNDYGLASSLYTQLVVKHGWLFTLLAVFFLTAMGVVGDLLESLVKRSAGVKDSSRLLPGHGGVLDRIDALLPVLPLAMMLFSI